MKNIQDNPLFQPMLQSLILKYGLFLNSNQCAEAIRASTSSRGLDESRKKSQDVPRFIQNQNGNILYPVQEVVEYQIIKSQEVVQTIY